jgi:hypothetical protein
MTVFYSKTAKNEDGVKLTFSTKNRVDRHLSDNFSTIFGCKMLGTGLKNILRHLCFEPEIQDGVKTKNGAQKRKKLLLNCQFSTN